MFNPNDVEICIKDKTERSGFVLVNNDEKYSIILRNHFDKFVKVSLFVNDVFIDLFMIEPSSSVESKTPFVFENGIQTTIKIIFDVNDDRLYDFLDKCQEWEPLPCSSELEEAGCIATQRFIPDPLYAKEERTLILISENSMAVV